MKVLFYKRRYLWWYFLYCSFINKKSLINELKQKDNNYYQLVIGVHCASQWIVLTGFVFRAKWTNKTVGICASIRDIIIVFLTEQMCVSQCQSRTTSPTPPTLTLKSLSNLQSWKHTPNNLHLFCSIRDFHKIQ